MNKRAYEGRDGMKIVKVSARQLSRLVREAAGGVEMTDDMPLEDAIQTLHAELLGVRDNPAWEVIENEGSARQVALVGDLMSLIDKFQALLPRGMPGETTAG